MTLVNRYFKFVEGIFDVVVTCVAHCHFAMLTPCTRHVLPIIVPAKHVSMDKQQQNQQNIIEHIVEHYFTAWKSSGRAKQLLSPFAQFAQVGSSW